MVQFKDSFRWGSKKGLILRQLLRKLSFAQISFATSSTAFPTPLSLVLNVTWLTVGTSRHEKSKFTCVWPIRAFRAPGGSLVFISCAIGPCLPVLCCMDVEAVFQ